MASRWEPTIIFQKLEIYETLWREAVAAFARGEPHLDPHLADKSKDLRRGVTLIARPSPLVQERVKEFLDRLAAVGPEQYFYRPEALHVTVMSIISGTLAWRKEIGRLAACRRVISEVLSRQRAFRIQFRGITASAGSVMIRGFPDGDGLGKIREELREGFARQGLGDLLDRRYKISTAHITVMRFRAPGMDWSRLGPVLERGREMDFGETTVDRLQLIWGDWYASAETVRVLQEYRLLG